RSLVLRMTLSFLNAFIHPYLPLFALYRYHNAVCLLTQHKQVMIQTVLIQIAVSFRVLPRCEHVNAVQFCFGNDSTLVDDEPVDRIASRNKATGKVMLRVETVHVPNLDQLHAINGSDTCLNSSALVLDVDVSGEFLGTF